MTQNDFEKYKNKKEEELERLKLKLQEEKGNVRALINKNKLNKHSRLRSSINLKQNEDNDELKETKIEVSSRKLSWSQESNLRQNNKNDIRKKESSKNNNIEDFDIDQQFDLFVEMGKGRINRSMSLQKTKYNFADILLKMRKRKEELVKFNQKMKLDVAKYFSK